MALTTGSQLGPYEILSAIGAGGMGAVYRARDTKLARDVALKVLPAEFALDPERLARFTREAQVLAALNHPNIAAIYGFEESAEGPAEAGHYVHALVLEFVDGPTLADRIAQGAIPLEDALPIARQIAEALEAAHEQGIIHRDLKPANIKVRPDGTVKVLDFGLAKLIESGSGIRDSGFDVRSQAHTQSPTITTPAMTMAGVILGTAAYMSPEQAKGRPADKRSDIWAFGCVLLEMLTGARTFAGDDVSDTLAAVLRGEPEWGGLPVDTPERIHGLLRRCLRKDPVKRLPHVAMARFEIDEVLTESPVPSSKPSPAAKPSFARRAVPVAIGMVLAAAITSGVWWVSRPQASPPIVTRFAIPLAEGEEAAPAPYRNVAISPDGSQIVYVANRRLILRSLSTVVPKVIPGTDTGSGVGAPAFSPDGQSIVYGSQERERSGGAVLKTISASGGVPITIAQLRANALFSLSWGADGILYGDSEAGVVRVSPRGGKPEVLVPLGQGEVIQGASMLPGGEAILFALGQARQAGTAPTLDLWDSAKVVVQILSTRERRTLVEGGSDPRYLPTGHVLFARSGTMFAVPFDVKRLQVTGGQIPMLEGVARSLTGRTASGYAHVDVSGNGTVVYATGPVSPTSEQPRLVMLDRAGKLEGLKMPPGFYERPRVSPDGTLVALGSEDANGAAVWIFDLSGNSSMRQLTFDGRNRYPIWSPDGAHVAFQSDREGDAAIFWQRSDGSAKAERVTKPDNDTTHVPESWSRDGKHLLYTVGQGPMNTLWVYSIDTKKGTPFGDVRSPRLISSSFSPDGRWVAYVETTGGLNQVFVQPFPATGVKYVVGMGARPQWSPDGKEIFFYRNEGTFVKTVTTHPSFTVSNEVALPFNVYAGRGPGTGRDADIMPDGKRFVAVVPSTETTNGARAIRQFEVVLNWFEELKQRSPAR